MSKLTAAQKADLAFAAMSQVANLVEFWSDLAPAGLEDVPATEVAEQLAIWMRRLPGYAWDMRLPMLPAPTPTTSTTAGA